MKEIKPQKVFFITVGLLYIIFLIISSFSEVGNILRLRTPSFGDVPNNDYNYLPFRTIFTYIFNFDQYNLSTWIFNLLGNVLIYLPLGIIAPILFSSIYRYTHIIYITVAIRIVIEVLQYKTSLGVFDVDDIILSLTGSLIGFSLYIKFIK